MHGQRYKQTSNVQGPVNVQRAGARRVGGQGGGVKPPPSRYNTSRTVHAAFPDQQHSSRFIASPTCGVHTHATLCS